ncbi:MAG: carbohydrate-binding domain-containing protein, partial [Bacteroidales bacterium]|nr:carbohydrate-binding domain-containing protein [Bacteroidales bacterium]
MMKRILYTLTLVVLALVSTNAQTLVKLYGAGYENYSAPVTNIDTIMLPGATVDIHQSNPTNVFSFRLNDIDSMKFVTATSNDIYITWNGSTVNVINPMSANGVAITTTGGNVNVVTTANTTGINYHLAGNTTNGSFAINSDKKFNVFLEGVSITSTTDAAFSSSTGKGVTVYLAGGTTNTFIDNASSTAKAAFYAKGNIAFYGTGTLSVTGNAKHAIRSDEDIEINNGRIEVPSSASDAFHADFFVINGGEIITTNTEGDGFDADGGYIEINGGSINISSSTDDIKGLKADSLIHITGGYVLITLSGNQSKAIKTTQDMIVDGGYLTFNISGNAVLEALGNGYDPSYATAIKTEGTFTMNNGSITMTLSGSGTKGISTDGDLTVNNGNITITNSGSGTTYTDSLGSTDSYTSACLKSDGNITLLRGAINCTATGIGGKAICTDGTMTLGMLGDADNALIINAQTTGERFYVTGTTSGGGGWGGPGGSGDNTDYANPKALKALHNLIINGGTITVNCSQTNEGGECIESKDSLIINGGVVDTYSNGDDAINAANAIIMNGGRVYAHSNSNDGIDSNGSIDINGGLIIGDGARQPETGIDCDNNRFSVTGGTMIAAGGSNSTVNAGTQHVLSCSLASGSTICVKDASNNVLLIYQAPTLNSTGGGG